MSTAEAMPNSSVESDPPDFHYEVLAPDNYHTSVKTQEELLDKYVRLLNPLVEEIVGSEDQPGYDKVVFLDKSARPLAWMLRAFWPHIAPQKRDAKTRELTVAPMPAMRFVNIDRLNWRKDPNKEIEEAGARDIEDEDVAGLRSIFQFRHHDKNDELVANKANDMDGQRILLVDEQSETGDTLKAARSLFERAFPSSKIATKAWISHPHSVSRKGERESSVKEIPMWYPPKDTKTQLHKDTGRGVLSPVRFNSEEPEHGDPFRFPPESYQFLSTKPYVPKAEFTEEEELELTSLREFLSEAEDPKEKEQIRKKIKALRREKDTESLQLRREIGQMLIDFMDGKIMPVITSEREEILGVPAAEYNAKAKVERAKRQIYR